MKLFKHIFIKYALFILLSNICFAIDFANEALLLTCQAHGHILYANCVAKTPITPDDISTFFSLKTTYNLCLQELNQPLPLISSLDPDIYANSPFTPCNYETGHLILYDICG